MLQRLGLPYRVVELAAGDTGFASARTYDLEVWAAGVGAWLEVSSSSTFTDFQARRANIRFRPDAKAKPEFVHTLNASGVAFPRTIIALLENNQAADGSVRVPEALVPYLGVERLAPACVATGFSASRRSSWWRWWRCWPGLSFGTGLLDFPPLPGGRLGHQPALFRRVRRAQRSAGRCRSRGACFAWESRCGRWAYRSSSPIGPAA